VLVGIQDQSFRYLPAVDANGAPTPLIPVGAVTLRR
jgi:hypothetical protein